ncbi:MAG: hypothetical protein US52_C0049G0003 [candidate division WS6 bacterium GW2011_GWA2_37_6]|uniref:YcxB-like protein domain-containing protein n=1 Tax=candidate division WS6 bacterium GW2011_GWA2_37_6 TaxID=1619087 RepID=A0A0G0H879_9BACT|nr:MAG: hypothetical protein US52_C0049G0003 [candidate division WS6 bacterium GW2011_GWA2_37_6]
MRDKVQKFETRITYLSILRQYLYTIKLSKLWYVIISLGMGIIIFDLLRNHLAQALLTLFLFPVIIAFYLSLSTLYTYYYIRIKNKRKYINFSITDKSLELDFLDKFTRIEFNNIKKVIVHNHVVIFKLKHGTSYILPIETSDKAELAKIRGKL